MLNLIKEWVTSLKHKNDETGSNDLAVIWLHGANQSGLSFQYLRSLTCFKNELVVEYDTSHKFKDNLEMLANEIIKVRGPYFMIGHSLGGKVAMTFACEQADRVQHLVVVDIAAKDYYPPYLDAVFRAMKRLNLSELSQRKEADTILQEWIPNWSMRQFVLTNLVRTEAGFEWQVNLEVLHASLPVIRKNSLLPAQRFFGPALLIRGEDSDFVEDSDVKRMRLHFPDLKCETIEKASHNVHVENRAAFLQTLIACLGFASD